MDGSGNDWIKWRERLDSIGSQEGETSFHCDLLAFLSVALHYGVDLVNTTWQLAFNEGGTSLINQAQMSARFFLAFKRSKWDFTAEGGSLDLYRNRYRVLITELLALEALRHHPNVSNLVGITWEIDKDAEVWPVLITQRSELGSLQNFLQSGEGYKLTTDDKLKFSAEIADALTEAHSRGIVHSDIKFENVLLFEEKDGISAKLIDFGYASFAKIPEQTIHVSPGTRPWQAPEYGYQTFTFQNATLMDVYSFGLFLTRLFLSDGLPNSIGWFDKHPGAKVEEDLIDRIDEMKKSSNDGFLQSIVQTLEKSQIIEAQHNAILRRLFEMTLCFDPQNRASMCDVVTDLVSSGTCAEIPAVTPLMDETCPYFLDAMHIVPSLCNRLPDFDEVDYLIHHAIIKGLEQRTNANFCNCYTNAAYQLGICYSIGFGINRDETLAHTWVNKARYLDPMLPELQSCLEGVPEIYEVGESPYVRLEEIIGHPVDIQYDPVRLYCQQKRLEKAETYLQQQLRDRAISLGASSPSRVAMLSVLAMVYFEEGKYSESDATFDEAYKCTVSAFGMDHSQTISTMNYRVKTLMSSWPEQSKLEKILLDLIAQKERLLTPHDNTVLHSRYQLGWVYYGKGLYEDAISTWKALADQRKLLNGVEHRETLSTLTSLSRALLAKGRLAEAETIQRDVVAASERTMEEDDQDNLEAKEALAVILLKRRKLVEAEELAFTAMSFIQDQYDDDDIRVVTMIMTWARTLAALGYIPESRPEGTPQPTEIMEDVVERLTQSYGENNPPTLVALAELALMWHRRGDSERAKVYAQSAVTGWERLCNGSGFKLSECQEMLSEIL